MCEARRRGRGEDVYDVATSSREIAMEVDRHVNTSLVVVGSQENGTEVAPLPNKEGTDVEYRDGDGLTPLIVAVVYGHDRIVALPIDAGAGMYVTYDGLTPPELCLKNAKEYDCKLP